MSLGASGQLGEQQQACRPVVVGQLPGPDDEAETGQDPVGLGFDGIAAELFETVTV